MKPQTQAHVESLERRLHYLESLLPEVCQLIDGVKQEWSGQGSWSEWDESVRTRLANYHLHREGLLELPEVDTLLIGELAQQSLDWVAAKRFEKYCASKGATQVKWADAPPALKDAWRSTAMAESARFMNVIVDNSGIKLIRARHLYIRQIRAIFAVPGDRLLYVDTGNQLIELKDEDTLPACVQILRLVSRAA